MRKQRFPERLVPILMVITMTVTGAAPLVAAPQTTDTLTVCPGGGCDFTSIQDAVDAADSGDTVFVHNGTYEESVLIEEDLLTLRGESESGVVIDVSGFDDRRGITARPANNDGFDNDKLQGLTIESLTVVGPSILDSSSSKHYGIHVFDAAALRIDDVTVKNSSRSELDVHAIQASRITNVTLDGRGTSGVGLGITDSKDVQVDHVLTRNNSWGGIALFTSGSFAPGGTERISVEDHASVDEAPPLYTQTHDGHEIRDLHLPQYDFVANHPAFPSFTFYFQELTPALDFAAGLNDAAGADDATVQSRVDGTFHVGPGMSVQVAVDAAPADGNVTVHAGTYTEQVVVDHSVTVAGADGATIEAPASLTADDDGRSHIVLVTGDGVETELRGLTIRGPGPSGCGSIHGGIAVKDGARAVIEDNAIVSIRDDPLSGCQNGVGVIVGRIWHDATGGTASAKIVNNTISDFQKSAVVVTGNGSFATIRDNALTCSGDEADDIIAQDAVQLWYRSGAQIIDNRIKQCRSTFFGAPRGVGIHLSEGVHDTRIIGNEIPGAQTAIAVMNYAPWTAEGDNARVRNIDILDNELLANDGAVYLAGSGEDIVVAGNQISQASALGAFVGPDTWLQDPPEFDDVAIRDNVFLFNDAPAILVRDSAGNVTAHFNQISGNDVGLLNEDDAVVDATHNWWGSVAGPNATANPVQGVAPTGDRVEGPAKVTPWCELAVCGPNRILHNVGPHPHTP